MCYCRFLIQISVRERHSDVTWNFVCDQWLNPEADKTIARRELSLTVVQPVTYSLRVISQQSIRDHHMWVSIFTCPHHSIFTRVQRLSCGFAFVLLSMLANIMFYKVRSPARDILIFSELTINLDTVVIGIQSAIIVFPINGLIILIFRKVGMNTGAFCVHYGGDSNIPTDCSDSSDMFTPTWWFDWVGWTLTIIICFVSSFFVIAYGLSNTHYKNVAWAFSFFMSASGNVLFIQPIKVAAWIMIAIFIFNSPVKPSFEVTQLDNLGKHTQVTRLCSLYMLARNMVSVFLSRILRQSCL